MVSDCDIMKKKAGIIMKKIAKLLVLFIIISVLSAACSATEKEVFDEDFVKNTEAVDLAGLDIIYKVVVKSNITESVLGYEVDSQFGDLAAQRVKDVKDKLNCNLIINYDNGYHPSAEFVTTSAAGIFVCDVINGISDMWADSARIGALVGLSELEDYIDFRNEEKWGYRKMLEVVYYEDDLYGVVPLLWPEVSVSYGSPIVINEDLISTLGVEDPRDLFENGKWTWDTFDECLGKYYLEEGGEVKHYSLTAGTGAFGTMFLLSNGSHYVEKDLSGNYVCGFYSNEARKAMEKGIEIYFGPNAKTINSTENVAQNLITGRTVLGSLGSDEIIGINGRIAKEMENFGIVCWPSGPDVDPGYIVGCHSNIERCIAFSRLSQFPEASAMVINALYEPFDEYPTLESIIDLMAKNYFYDHRDAEIFYKMYFNSDFTYFHYSMYDFMHAWLSPSKSVSEYLESNESTIKEKFEEYVVPSMRGVDAVWGNS